jgi:hypothetical protein
VVERGSKTYPGPLYRRRFDTSGSLTFDPDAAAYIAAVEAVDTQALEPAVREAINAFVIGCKADGIWNAIKASCIMAGAGTRLGAMVPLVGAAPTSFDFVDADYDRKMGLAGDASTKYLDSNRNNNADPQNSKHISVWQSAIGTTSFPQIFMGTTSGTGRTRFVSFAAGGVAIDVTGSGPIISTMTTGFLGVSRNGTTVSARNNSNNSSVTSTSETPLNANIGVFARADGGVPGDPRISFYSIGESLDLALLDARVTTLMNAFAAAIP